MAKPDDNKETETSWSAVSLAWQLGYTIAIPIVLLAFAGAYADRFFGTSPLFLLLGVFLSMVISLLGILRKMKQILGTFHKKS